LIKNIKRTPQTYSNIGDIMGRWWKNAVELKGNGDK
jgi:hypothetical protein